ncbi:Os10g0154101 [Oryza sativa Japonica Group]|uniref:Os10g0154101 protein n=1 Tax=Oryza sativa subsp. japonica TaxID=39947 RepID=A0A0P0XS66_ORYSJ|nr:Os10g0154101 [Oryza sativa Japonica Group]
MPEDGRRDGDNTSKRTRGKGRGCRWTDGVAAVTVDEWERSGTGTSTGRWKGMRAAADRGTTTRTDVGRSGAENSHPVAYSESSAN